MKRISVKTLAIVVGLSLGWYVAGMTSTFAAGDHDGHGHDTHAAADHAEKAGHDDHTGQGQDLHGDEHASADKEAAKHLKPEQHDIAWYPKIIYSIIGLFVVAIIVGMIGKSKGVREPGVLASEEDAEQAHGADEEDTHH